MIDMYLTIMKVKLSLEVLDLVSRQYPWGNRTFRPYTGRFASWTCWVLVKNRTSPKPQHLSRRSCPGCRRPHTHRKAPPPIHAILHEEDCELFVRIRIKPSLMFAICVTHICDTFFFCCTISSFPLNEFTVTQETQPSLNWHNHHPGAGSVRTVDFFS